MKIWTPMSPGSQAPAVAGPVWQRNANDGSTRVVEVRQFADVGTVSTTPPGDEPGGPGLLWAAAGEASWWELLGDGPPWADWEWGPVVEAPA